MKKRIGDRVVLVTGASSGIGKATAEAFLKSGATVYVAARRVEKMKELEDRGARVVALDVTNEESIRATVDVIHNERGGVDVLVNNAGYGSYGTVEDVPPAEARRQFDVNVFGLARLTQLVLPTMRQKRSGTIINVTSMGGKVYTYLGAWYHATKHAVEGLSDALRLEVKPFGIDVVVIEPGMIRTEWDSIAANSARHASAEGTGAYAEMTEKVASAMERLYASPMASKPELIARTIVRAASARRPKTRYVAGAFARPMIVMRSLFGDRIFDRLLAIGYGVRA